MTSFRWEYWGVLLFVGVLTPAVFGFELDKRFAVEARENLRPTIFSSWETRTESRAFALEIPAPRGQITDRGGRPLALTRVEYYLALQFPTVAQLPDDEVLLYGRRAVAKAGEVLGREVVVADEVLLGHYLLRRWVPMSFSERLSDLEREAIKEPELVGAGLRAMPRYLRYYPEGELASHIIGYVGLKAARSKRALISGEPIFPKSEGRDGLEVAFDGDLRGKSGLIDYVFDASGVKLKEERVARPEPGHHVVTTLDLEMQQLAEVTLGSYCRRGAFVVIDVRNGDILAMASRPTFDLNQFVPSVSREDYARLREDPDIPLFARAFRGLYPPASTFKIATALGVLEAGEITP
ncbi:MAG: penicillin-binding transpeptidase domain-containing protein, partial [Verrucomicrobiota bacterium]